MTLSIPPQQQLLFSRIRLQFLQFSKLIQTLQLNSQLENIRNTLHHVEREFIGLYGLNAYEMKRVHDVLFINRKVYRLDAWKDLQEATQDDIKDLGQEYINVLSLETQDCIRACIQESSDFMHDASENIHLNTDSNSRITIYNTNEQERIDPRKDTTVLNDINAMNNMSNVVDLNNMNNMKNIDDVNALNNMTDESGLGLYYQLVKRKDFLPLKNEIAKFIEYPFILLLDRDHTRGDVPISVLEYVMKIWNLVMQFREQITNDENTWLRYLAMIRNIYYSEKYFENPSSKQRGSRLDHTSGAEIGLSNTTLPTNESRKMIPTNTDTESIISQERDLEKEKVEHVQNASQFHNIDIISRDELQSLILQTFTLLLIEHAPADWSNQSKILFILPEIITSLLQVSENTNYSRKVRKLALQQLRVVLSKLDQKRIQPIVPGIFSALVRLIQRGTNSTLGHSVLQEAYKLVQFIIVCAYKDPVLSKGFDAINLLQNMHLSSKDTSENEEVQEKLSNLKLKLEIEDNSRESETSPSNKKNDNSEENKKMKEHSSLIELQKRLEIIFSAEKFYSLHSLAKESMLVATYNIHRNCKYTLKHVNTALVEIIMIASFDDSEYSTHRIRRIGSILLQQVNDWIHTKHSSYRKVENFSFFEKQFATHLRKLYTIPTSVNESEKISRLSILNAYIRTFGEKLWPSIHSQFSEIYLALLSLLKFKDSGKIQEVTYQSNINLKGSGQEIGKFFLPKFQYLHEDQTIQCCQTLCQNIGEIGEANFLLAHFRSQISSKKNLLQKESMFFLKEILKGASKRTDFKRKSTSMKELLDFILSNEFMMNWKVDQESNILYLHHYTIMTCLTLETIGVLVKILVPIYSETLLIKCLFPVLQKLGDPHGLIQDAALHTLFVISQCMGYKNIAELVSKNADYITDDICYRMQDLNLNPEAPTILGVLLQHTELYSTNRNIERSNDDSSQNSYEDMIGLVRDTLSSIFEGMDNHLHASKNDAVSLSTFFSMLASIARLLITRKKKLSQQKSKDSNSDDSESDSEDPLVKKPSSYPRLQKDSESTLEMELMKQILQRCEHFAQVNDIRIQTQVMDLFLESSEYFIHDKKVDSNLLPLLHLLWPSIHYFIADDEHPLMQLKCLNLLSQLLPKSQSIGEFFYGRIIDDIWPLLYQKLKQNLHPKFLLQKYEERVKLFSEKYKVDEKKNLLLKHIYEQEYSNPEYKVRIQIIKFLACLLQSPIFRDRLSTVPSPQEKKVPLSFATIFEVGIPYLDERQPIELQNYTKHLFRTLASIHADPLWYYLCELFGTICKFNDEPCQQNEIFSKKTIKKYTSRFGNTIPEKFLEHNASELLSYIENEFM